MRVEMLWCRRCPHPETRAAMIAEVMGFGPANAELTRLEDCNESAGAASSARFVIGVEGSQGGPGWECREACSPGCRISFSDAAGPGLPPRSWLLTPVQGRRN